MAAAAYLEHLFGDLWVDGATGTAIPINGLSAAVTTWHDDAISLTIFSALRNLPHPFTAPRDITVKFHGLQENDYTVDINHQPARYTKDELEQGIHITI